MRRLLIDVSDDRLAPVPDVHAFNADDLRSAASQPAQGLDQDCESARQPTRRCQDDAMAIRFGEPSKDGHRGRMHASRRPLAAIEDRPRPGKEPVITPEAKAWLVSLACDKAKERTSIRNPQPMQKTQFVTNYDDVGLDRDHGVDRRVKFNDCDLHAGPSVPNADGVIVRS